MAIRYFGFKQGSEKVNGAVIRVDTLSEPNERLGDFNGDFAFPPHEFRFLKKEGNYEVYEMSIQHRECIAVPVRDSLGGIIGAPYAVKTGESELVGLAVDNTGLIKLIGSSSQPIFISEISEEEAEKRREAGGNWALQRMYVMESPVFH